MILLYTIEECPYCVQARELLLERGLSFEEIDLSDRRDDLIALKETTGWMTVPQIFIDGSLIGGYDELRSLLADQAAGVPLPGRG
jgi:glutaredoxin